MLLSAQGNRAVTIGVLLATLCAPLILSAAEASQGPTTLSNAWTINIRRGSDSTPAIGRDGSVYFGTFTGRFWAVSPRGTVKWIFDTKKVARSNMEIRSSPALDETDASLYFGCRDNRLYALTTGGKLKWTFKTDGWIDSSPAIATDGTVYVGSWDNNFYAIQKTGESKWHFPSRGQIVSSPAIGKDGTVYFGSHDGMFYALTPQGAKAWDYSAGSPIISSPAIAADGAIYFTAVSGFFHALDPNGNLRWKLKTGGMTESSPVITPDRTICVGVNNGIWGISPEGEKLWEQPLMRGRIQQPVQATPVALDNGALYVLSQYGMLYRWNAEHKPVEKFYLYGAGHASPVVSDDGTVYMAGSFTNMIALSGTAKIAKTPWPKFRADQQNTGRVSK